MNIDLIKKIVLVPYTDDQQKEYDIVKDFRKRTSTQV